MTIGKKVLAIKTAILCCFLLLAAFFANAQEYDSLELSTDDLKAELAALEAELAEMDTLSLFNLLDSLLTATAPSSRLTIGMDYVRNAADIELTNPLNGRVRNRTLTQKSLSPSLSYYHKSGLSASIISYFDVGSDEHDYSLTTLSFGYFDLIGSKFSYLISYDRSFYAQQSTTATDEVFEESPQNSINLSPNIDFNVISTGIDYSYIFGNDQTSHRIEWDVTGYVNFKKLGFIDKISLQPSFSLQWGNQNVTVLSLDQSIRADNIPDWVRELPQTERRQILSQIQFENIESSDENIFGLLNYEFSLPIRISVDKFRLSASYHYIIPTQPIIRNVIEQEQASSFNVGLSYTIDFRK